jgi:hypothetical protein
MYFYKQTSRQYYLIEFCMASNMLGTIVIRRYLSHCNIMKCQVKVLERLYNLDIMAFIVTGLNGVV